MKVSTFGYIVFGVIVVGSLVGLMLTSGNPRYYPEIKTHLMLKRIETKIDQLNADKDETEWVFYGSINMDTDTATIVDMSELKEGADHDEG